MNDPNVIVQINKIMELYKLPHIILKDKEPWLSDYDPLSARINYALIRSLKPRTVVEFGTRGGRCTHDILWALTQNETPFHFKAYEIDEEWRKRSQVNIDNYFGNGAVQIGKDIMKAKDIPDGIDYLFVDNSHDYDTTKWVFEYLLPKKCVDNALVHFDDMVIYGDFKFTVDGGIPKKDGEMYYFYELVKKKKLPLIKLFWGWEQNLGMSSSWWRYKKNE